MRTRRLVLFVFVLWGLPVFPQFVSGEWVERGEREIVKHRQAEVSFLVFDDQGKIAADAEIRIEQLKHAFTLGFAVHKEFPVDFDPEAEGWRAFNAVSLAPLSSWRQVQPTGPDTLKADTIDQAIRAASALKLEIHWGPLVSADAFDLPEWVVPLRGDALSDAARSYAHKIAMSYRSTVHDADTVEKTIDHDRFAPAALRLLALDLQAAWPTASPSLRYAGALSGRRAFEVVKAMDATLKQRLDTEEFNIEQAFPPRAIAQDRLEPALKRVTRHRHPLTIGSLEIAGSQSIESAVNTETVLRTLFAEPMIKGIFFAGLTADQFVEPSAALFDENGEVTPVLRTADRLFRETWWTNETLTTDDLGRATARVFLGDHRVTATLPDGSSVGVVVRLDDNNESPREILLMPVATENEADQTE
ncbi:MAG: hypothetical protein AAGH99_02295 [Planctomycetota bacterium]